MILAQELSQQATDTISIITAVLTTTMIILIMVGGAIYLMIYSKKLDKAKEEYMKTLTEEQKLVIYKFTEIKNKVRVFEKKGEKK